MIPLLRGVDRAAFTAALAARLRSEGVPVKIIATGLKLSDLSIFTRDPTVKKLEDLKGKTLAIDMGGSQYQIVSIYARGIGMKLNTDVTLISANFALSKAQLIAGRVDRIERNEFA